MPKKSLIFLVILSVGVLSCGIKGPPRPPSEAETTIQAQKVSEIISRDNTEVQTPEKKKK